MIDESNFDLHFLELQRSALIDTQTLFQIMIEKGICTVDEILSVHDRIESNNPDVRQLDNAIAELKGEEVVPRNNSKSALLAQLQEMKKELMSRFEENNKNG